jgi:hypothetical protein
MRTIAILLLLTTTANAECMLWGHDIQGNRICVADDLVNRNQIILDPPAFYWNSTGGDTSLICKAGPSVGSLPTCTEGSPYVCTHSDGSRGPACR